MSSFGSSGNAGPVSYVMARQGGVLLPLTPPRRKERPKVSAVARVVLVPVFSSVP